MAETGTAEDTRDLSSPGVRTQGILPPGGFAFLSDGEATLQVATSIMTSGLAEEGLAVELISINSTTASPHSATLAAT